MQTEPCRVCEIEQQLFFVSKSFFICKLDLFVIVTPHDRIFTRNRNVVSQDIWKIQKDQMKRFSLREPKFYRLVLCETNNTNGMQLPESQGET